MDMKSSVQARVVSVVARACVQHGLCWTRCRTDARELQRTPSRWLCFHAGFHSSPLFFLSRKFLKASSGNSPGAAPGHWDRASARQWPRDPRPVLLEELHEAVIEAAEQLEVLHPGDVAGFRRR